jgi:biopolymer transport protein ExbB
MMNARILALLLAVAAALLFMPLPGWSQAEAGKAAPAAESTPAVHKKTMWEKIKEGGVMMIPLALCSIFTVYLIWDGVVRTSKRRTAPDEHVNGVKNLFRAGDYVGAYKFCKDNPSPLTNVLRVGISLLGDGKQMAEEGMLAELAKENSRVQTFISYLSVIGVCTPMIGLTGTVSGMIKAFENLGSAGIGDPSGLAAAIGEVLVATLTGLAVAIPAFGAFYYLRSRGLAAIHHIQDTVAVLFRKMPYEQLHGAHVGGEEIYAAPPNWSGAAAAEASAH